MADTSKKSGKAARDAAKEETVIVEWVGNMKIINRYRPNEEKELAALKVVLNHAKATRSRA